MHWILAEAAQEGYNYSAQLLKMVLILGAMALFCFISLRMMRRLGTRRMMFGNGRHHIKIIERRPLSPKSSLFLIEVGGRGLIVSDAPGGVHLVAEVPIEVTEEEAAASPFSALLKEKFLKKSDPLPNNQ